MSTPFPAPAGVALLDDVNRRWPNRSKASDGWIGDPAHAARKSDHNPRADGLVLARDFTAEGIDVPTLIAALKRDPRVNYIIHDWQIMFYDDGFIPHPYNGPNGHESHIHVSFRHAELYWNNRASWNLNPPATPKDADMPNTRKFSRSAAQPLAVNRQEWLRLSNDGQNISAEFGARRFSTTAQIYLSGLPKGEEVQVQAVRTDANGKVLGSYGTQEIIGTSGGTFGMVHWEDDLPAGQRLRFYIKCFREGVTVTSSRVVTHSWAL